MTTMKKGLFYAARNDRDSERFGKELYGGREHGRIGWCALVAGVRVSMTHTKAEAEAKAAELNRRLGR